MKYFNSALVMGLCLAAQPALSLSVQEQIDKGYEYCDNLRSLAATVMKSRQSGQSKALTEFTVKGMGSDAKSLVDFAYDYPVKDTPQDKDFAVNNFSDAAREGCRKSVLKKIKQGRANQGVNRHE